MFFTMERKPALGIEITAEAVRIAAIAGKGEQAAVPFSRQVALPAGAVNAEYAGLNIRDRNRVIESLGNCLEGFSAPRPIRAALCLPDEIFRVQTLEFEQMPKKSADIARLITWRMEKTAAFDVADAILRYQVLRSRESGFTVLACVAKKPVIEQYEALLLEAGIEPWTVGLSSFSAVNFYAPYLSKRSAAYALAHVWPDSFATIVAENNGARFYRFKDIRRGRPEEMQGRLAREIEDSLHFYTHLDRTRQADVGRLYLTGETAMRDAVAGELRQSSSLELEVLTPGDVLPSFSGAAPEMAAALGSGKLL
jgi:Tfp pilus assembly PilM family ATPase